MHIQAVHSFQPATHASPVRFAHQHDHTCQGDTCSLPKKEVTPKKPEGNWFVRIFKNIWNWLVTFFTSPFKDLKAVHNHLVQSTEPHDHGKDEKKPATGDHKCCGHDHDHDHGGGHVHGPNCKH